MTGVVTYVVVACLIAASPALLVTDETVRVARMGRTGPRHWPFPASVLLVGMLTLLVGCSSADSELTIDATCSAELTDGTTNASTLTEQLDTAER